jgi:hypothetical protein
MLYQLKVVYIFVIFDGAVTGICGFAVYAMFTACAVLRQRLPVDGRSAHFGIAFSRAGLKTPA